MKKYYCITLLAFIVVILLQGYNISLRYKGYINNKTDKVNSTLKIAIDEGYAYRDWETDRKSTRLNSSHITRSRMPSSA